MQAAVLEDKGRMSILELPTPAPKLGQVLLKVRASSICGSDVHRYTRGHKVVPLVLGHETAGEIVDLGEGVDPGLLGRRAAIIPLVPCFQCEQCAAGRYSACPRYSFIGSRQNGGYAEFVEIPARNALLLPDTVPFEAAALIEPSSVARHILDLGQFEAGQSAMVLGAGSIGLMTVQWLHILGAGKILVSDISPVNRQAALDLGAQAAFDPRSVDVPQEVRTRTGFGADLVLETAGVPQTLQMAVQLARPGGSLVCAGNQPPDASLPMTWVEDLMRRELRLRGCFMSYSAPFPGHEWTDSVEMLAQGRLNMEAMISHRFPLAEAPRVFSQIANHEFGYRKIILTP
jgi:L-iditol 2-dehydrogenase